MPGVCCPDQGVNQGVPLVDLIGQDQPQQSLPPINQGPGFDQDDLDIVVQPQGSTKRPNPNLPSTTPRPSPLLQGTLQTVPGSNQGDISANHFLNFIEL